MAWTTPATFAPGQLITSAFLNNLRDNLLETAAGKASTAGEYFVATGANALVARVITQSKVDTTETTTSTSATDLATVGPVVGPLTTGPSALVLVTGAVANNTVNSVSLMGYEISGATTLVMNSGSSIRFTSSTANATVTCTVASVAALAPGSNTFTAKYFVGSGTGSFSIRRLIVMPF